MQVVEYDQWVKNYIGAQQRVAEGQITPKEADWSGVALYLKEANETLLTSVQLVDVSRRGRHEARWTYWDDYSDGEYDYHVGKVSLSFSYDPYEGLTRYTLTIVPRESVDDPIPESWNGSLLFEKGCPLLVMDVRREVWEWVEAHTLRAGVNGDLLVTPHGEDPGVTNAIASREIAVRRSAD
ncbi:hypothetical protein ABT340_15720 [Streptosporangium sp. NPDC000239]|uniref:hypothetical protein n=1 Tax=Streptosporangium sp. NPDC000239 TaxID=3154248 RepID=UPI003322D98B